MENKKLNQFGIFKKLCLKNADSFLTTAESLLGKNANHIVYHLSIIALEEIGKIFVGWYQLTHEEKWGKNNTPIPIDDHVKKIFWAVWGPTFMNEKITKGEIDELQNLSLTLHNKRLEVMYTELSDTISSNLKVSDAEAESIVKAVGATLKISYQENEVDYNTDLFESEDLKWFLESSEVPEKWAFIWGHKSQEKLIELKNIVDWIAWLKESFENEEKKFTDILENELKKTVEKDTKKLIPKWDIQFTIKTPSHSIRPKNLNLFNKYTRNIILKKGADNHTLIINIIVPDKVPLTNVWAHGWAMSKVLVASLNVATNGIFYWHAETDPDKYYDKITDLENGIMLKAELGNKLKLNWKDKKMFLNEEELGGTIMVLNYFMSIISTPGFDAVNDYITGLGMLSKIDIHLRLETESFIHFYSALKKAVQNNKDDKEEFDLKKLVSYELEGLLTHKTEFEKIMDLAAELELNGKVETPITLTEVIAMKMYCGSYFLTLAARKVHGEKIRLTLSPPLEANQVGS